MGPTGTWSVKNMAAACMGQWGGRSKQRNDGSQGCHSEVALKGNPGLYSEVGSPGVVDHECNMVGSTHTYRRKLHTHGHRFLWITAI